MAWKKRDHTVDLSSKLVGVTGQAWLTRSGKIRVLRLIDVKPTTIGSGQSFLVLDPNDRPAYRVDDMWPIAPGSATARSGFVIPGGGVGVWAPSTSDAYRLTLTWGTA